MNLELQAARHAALGDRGRLHIVRELVLGDRTVAELGRSARMPTNLLAHHLGVLEESGLIVRRVSEGDQRKRYVSLMEQNLPAPIAGVHIAPGSVVFVCTQNSARSQFAAELWRHVAGTDVASAGSKPAARVNPKAVRVAGELGIDLSEATPGGYDRLPPSSDLVISVCDRALEGGLPKASHHLHWSVPDPAARGRLEDFRAAFADITNRVERLARTVS